MFSKSKFIALAAMLVMGLATAGFAQDNYGDLVDRNGNAVPAPNDSQRDGAWNIPIDEPSTYRDGTSFFMNRPNAINDGVTRPLPNGDSERDGAWNRDIITGESGQMGSYVNNRDPHDYSHGNRLPEPSDSQHDGAWNNEVLSPVPSNQY